MTSYYRLPNKRQTNLIFAFAQIEQDLNELANKIKIFSNLNEDKTARYLDETLRGKALTLPKTIAPLLSRTDAEQEALTIRGGKIPGKSINDLLPHIKNLQSQLNELLTQANEFWNTCDKSGYGGEPLPSAESLRTIVEKMQETNKQAKQTFNSLIRIYTQAYPN